MTMETVVVRLSPKAIRKADMLARRYGMNRGDLLGVLLELEVQRRRDESAAIKACA